MYRCALNSSKAGHVGEEQQDTKRQSDLNRFNAHILVGYSDYTMVIYKQHKIKAYQNFG